MDVRILGALEVSDSVGPVDLGLRQARVLFAALALEPGLPVRTARIAEVLWPAGPPPRWEATVQSHVSRLRRALEPDRPPRAPSARLATRGDAYVLHLADDELDARRFERLAAEGRAALAREEHGKAEELLGLALAEWRGPVLADLGDVAPLATETDRLEELRVLATEERAEAALALGEHARAVADLETLVSAYPLREHCWELLLLALYRSGRQGEALRRYQDLRMLLVGELGIEPGPALRALEGAILRQEIEVAPRPPVAAPVVPREVPLAAWLNAPRDEFIGRAAELDLVLDAFKRTAGGERRLALIAGEPGIGKTRLVREACRDLLDAGALVLGGRCVEEPLHVLQPFAEAIERLAVAHGDRLARDVPGDAAALAHLVPGLARHAVPLPTQDAESHSYLVFRAVSSLVAARTLGQTVVIVLDDLQWAAPATLNLLSHLLRDDDRGPLLVLATVRDTEPNPALEAVLVNLRRERRVDHLGLRGLKPVEVQALAAARGSTEDASLLASMTEGNPFYVEELVRHVAESGGHLTAVALPDSVRDTIARRLLRLPAETRRLLGVAAVAGSEFRLDVLARVEGTDIEAVDDLLVLATRVGVVSEQVSRVGVYGFSHSLFQTVLREGLGAARRARVHRRVGEALAALGGPDSEVARHLLAAAQDGSDVVPGVEAALAAASNAQSHFAYDDAVAIMRSAWNVLKQKPSLDPALSCRVAITLSFALRRAGLYEERAPLLEEAWAWAQETGDRELLADVVDEGLSGVVVAAEPWVSRAEEVNARFDAESGRRILFSAVLARVRSEEPGDAARQLGEWALARAGLLDPKRRREVISYSLSAVSAFSPIERVVDLARAALAAGRESGETAEIVQGLSTLRQAHLAAGDLSASDEAAREYEALVRSTRLPRFMAGVEQRRAMRALLAGRFVEAEAHAHEAVRLQPTREFIEALAVQVFALRLEQGRLDEVRESVESWAARNERVAWQLGLGVLLAELGESARAAESLASHAGSGFETVPRDDLYFLCLGVAATAAYLVQDGDAAAALYEILAPHASRVVVAAEGALCWGSIHRFLGPLSAILGNADRAVMHFEASMSVHERLGALPFLARDRLTYAAVLRASGGDPVRIESLARTGLTLATELGMRGVVDRFQHRFGP